MAGTFELRVAEWASQAKENADLVVRKVTLDLWARLIDKSPVDTGAFRRNWQYSVNARARGVVSGNWTSENRAPRPETPNVSAAGIGKVIWITNNLPYANRLETGWSKQAPLGMVGITAMEFNSIVSTAAREARDGLGVVGG
jgi:hypothetical protein